MKKINLTSPFKQITKLLESGQPRERQVGVYKNNAIIIFVSMVFFMFFGIVSWVWWQFTNPSLYLSPTLLYYINLHSVVRGFFFKFKFNFFNNIFWVFILFQDSYSEVSLGSLLFRQRGSQLWQRGISCLQSFMHYIYMYNVAFGVPLFPNWRWVGGWVVGWVLVESEWASEQVLS